jgi:drug/metabolite transporter (DMT)-like permease
MTPLLALVFSLLFEGLRRDALTALGAALAVSGNAMMLRPALLSPLMRGAPAAQ